MLLVNVPGLVRMSVVEKVFALEIPETVNVPLYSELAIPVGLAVLVTLLILNLRTNHEVVWNLSSEMCTSTIIISFHE